MCIPESFMMGWCAVWLCVYCMDIDSMYIALLFFQCLCRSFIQCVSYSCTLQRWSISICVIFIDTLVQGCVTHPRPFSIIYFYFYLLLLCVGVKCALTEQTKAADPSFFHLLIFCIIILVFIYFLLWIDKCALTEQTKVADLSWQALWPMFFLASSRY